MGSYKIGEFAAHAAAVNCLRIGRKSSGVLVTGGEDKKVNVWAIGKPSAILSLSGHQSAVECVNFDHQEEVVAAGGQNGTIKLWDLNSSKVVRTLTGHRSSCLSLEFHPFGDFLASGSLDTNLKVWDLRRKDCIQTYKGHSKGVKRLSISPDGKWIASGCESGQVKLWELSTGRLVHEFKPHDHQVTGIEFHPHEFILATSSADKTVRIWDLESWDLLDTIGPEAVPVRAISFHPEGRDVLVATGDGFKSWSWEPVVHHDTVPVEWSKLADMSVQDHRLIGCSFHNSVVGMYVVDLRTVAPFAAPAEGGAAESGAAMDGRAFGSSNGTGATAGAAGRASGGAADNGSRPAAVVAVVQPPAGRLSRQGSEGRQQQQQQQQQPRPERASSYTERTSSSAAAPASQHDSTAAAAAAAAAAPLRHERVKMVSTATEVGDSLTRGTVQPGELRGMAVAAERQQAVAARPPRPAAVQTPPGGFPDVEIRVPAGPSPLHQQQYQQQQQQRPLSGSSSAGVSRRSSGHDLHAAQASSAPPADAYMHRSPRDAYGDAGPAPLHHHLQQQHHHQQQHSQPQQQQAGPAPDPILQAAAARPSTRSDLSRLLSALNVAKGFIGRGNVEGACKAVAATGDAAAAAALLEALRGRKDAFALPAVESVVKLLEQLLASDHECQTATALDVLGLLLRGPGQVIKETCGANVVGVDLSFEQRRQRCVVAKLALQGLGLKLAVQGRGGGPQAVRAAALAVELQQLG